jgi:hypothetical protein
VPVSWISFESSWLSSLSPSPRLDLLFFDRRPRATTTKATNFTLITHQATLRWTVPQKLGCSVWWFSMVPVHVFPYPTFVSLSFNFLFSLRRFPFVFLLVMLASIYVFPLLLLDAFFYSLSVSNFTTLFYTMSLYCIYTVLLSLIIAFVSLIPHS